MALGERIALTIEAATVAAPLGTVIAVGERFGIAQSHPIRSSASLREKAVVLGRTACTWVLTDAVTYLIPSLAKSSRM